MRRSKLYEESEEKEMMEGEREEENYVTRVRKRK